MKPLGFPAGAFEARPPRLQPVEHLLRRADGPEHYSMLVDAPHANWQYLTLLHRLR